MKVLFKSRDPQAIELRELTQRRVRQRGNPVTDMSLLEATGPVAPAALTDMPRTKMQ